ncbi:MAG: preprotein translocase subunit SecE [Deltaproteobacteria bacterium]|nr:preprotein translocase subunit SecE [Deltaproteobacteria bacterium]MBM4429910.1 preprotein translocase subunit SecE [Chloroflexota bacterium]
MTSAVTGNRITRYFKEVRAEIRKVTWPPREEVVRLSAIVIATLFVASVFMALVDYAFSWLMRLIIGLGVGL